MPFFISKYLQLILGNYVTSGILPEALFSFIAFFLFLAVLPLVYAPETLPAKTMKDRELKNYIEKAKKIAQKEEEKEQGQLKNKAQKSPRYLKKKKTAKNTKKRGSWRKNTIKQAYEQLSYVLPCDTDRRL